MEHPPAALISSGHHRTHRKQGEGADIKTMNHEGGNLKILSPNSHPSSKDPTQPRSKVVRQDYGGLRSPPELWCSEQGQGCPLGRLTVGSIPSAVYSVVWSGPTSMGGGPVCRCCCQPSFFTFTDSVRVHTCHDIHVEARRKFLMVVLSFHAPVWALGFEPGPSGLMTTK